MAIPLEINGQTFQYPEPRDKAWGADATAWAAAVTTGMLQKEGGLFLLLDDVDFGPNFGLISSYYTSRTANAASAGSLRLAKTDGVYWRNNANSSDLGLTISASDVLEFNGSPVTTLLSVTDTATIDLTLSAGDLTADIVSDSIADALINSAAAIALTKLAAMTASRAVVSDGSGFLVPATTTATEIGYVNGVTSSIQTQLDAKQASGNYITALTGDVVAAGPGSVAATIQANAVTNSKIANGTIDLTAKVTGALPIANGGTGQITKTPAFDALSPMTTGGDLIYGGASGTGTRLVNGSAGTVLTSAGTTLPPTWSAVSVTTAVASKTTTYPITTSDNVILCDASGGAFTVTLPTAIGNTGRSFQIKKTDSSINIVTIATTSSQTIDGVVGTTLNTQNEDISVISDGANWTVLYRRIPSVWTTTTLALTGSGSNPSKGTYTENAYYMRVGGSVIFQYSFVQTVAGTAGTGFYIWTMPNSWAMDTSKVYTSGDNAATSIGYGQVSANANASSASVTLACYGSTQWVLYCPNIQGGGGGLTIGASSFGLNNGTAKYSFFTYPIPISGWNG